MVQLLAKKENPGLELNFSHNADIPSTNPATAPYACHGVFTDRSIFSLSLSRSQIPTGTAVTDCNHKHGLMSTCRHDVDMFTPLVRPQCFIFTEACSCRLNWPISREKFLKIDWSIKMPWHWLIIGVTGS